MESNTLQSQQRKNIFWVPTFFNNSTLLPLLCLPAAFSVCEHRHKLNGSPELLWVRSNTSTMLMLQEQPQLLKSKAGTILWKVSSLNLSVLWCFPLSLPSTSHAQMLCSLLFYSSQHCFLSFCCCVMPIMLQRQLLPWDFLFVSFPWVLW